MRSPFGWCTGPLGARREHSRCRRVALGGKLTCGCTTAGCPCAVMNYWFPDPHEEIADFGVQSDEDLVK